MPLDLRPITTSCKLFNGAQIDGTVVTGLLRIAELEVEDDLAIDFLLVAAEWRGCELRERHSVAKGPVDAKGGSQRATTSGRLKI